MMAAAAAQAAATAAAEVSQQREREMAVKLRTAEEQLAKMRTELQDASKQAVAAGIAASPPSTCA